MVNIYDGDISVIIEQDASGSTLRAIKDEIAQAKAVLQRKIDAGLSVKDFQAADGLKKCFDAAETGVQSMWDAKHE
ncbi:hypothetical protein [Desulfovibrio inopinatus]|uniref:hypothetical protein n=1 Tax=Desulfovibrio inopinatus TaxID=102109 RepID=UPI000406487B|nr:hypothetical protein [Desulfovibrio inopinatus]